MDKPKGSGKMKVRANKQVVSRGSNHQWTREEDRALVECLHHLASNSRWKSDNCTFKIGYLAYLETLLEQKLPNAKLKVDPHIKSQVKTMKRQYNAISEMLNAS